MIGLTAITILFSAYIIYVWVKYGIQYSISASIYVWKHTNAQPWTDRLILMHLLIAMGIIYMMLIPQWYGFITGVAICSIGIAGDYQAQLPWVRNIHNWSSFIGIPGALLNIGLYYGGIWNYGYFIVFVPFSLLMFYYKPQNYIWWVEKIVFVLVTIGLFKNII